MLIIYNNFRENRSTKFESVIEEYLILDIKYFFYKLNIRLDYNKRDKLNS